MNLRESYLAMLSVRQGVASDGHYAGQLGISRQTWQGIRTNKIPLSDTVIINSVQLFPELWVSAAEALLGKRKRMVWKLFKKEAQHGNQQETKG